MKALMDPSPNNQRPKQPRQPQAQPTMNEKLAMLSSKWKVS